jgi:5-methylcytosine-specific restriction enzyme A
MAWQRQLTDRAKYQWMYSTPLWRRLRSQQLKDKPLCERCLARGLVTPANIVHHTIPHKGDWDLFATAPLASLCKRCHDSTEQTVERYGFSNEIGVDGWPVDPNHPTNRRNGAGGEKTKKT